MRSIFEYGSVCFLHCPDSTIGILQKVQNKAIRVCLKLPRYVNIGLLHESACLPMVKDRLLHLGSKMVAKMRAGNPLMKELIQKKEGINLQRIITQSQTPYRSHRSPLDVILPAQQGLLSSV